MSNPKDRFDREYVVGDVVVKAETTRGWPNGLSLRRVITIKDSKVYLDGVNPVALKYPSRCIIVSDIVPATVKGNLN